MTKLFAGILQLIYSLIGNYGISLIIFTILIKLVLFPLAIVQRRGLEANKRMQPKMAELQKKYAKDKNTLNEKMMELYKEENFNPAAGCLPMLIQLPIIFILFRILRDPIPYLGIEALEQSFLWLPNMVGPDLLSNIIPGLTGTLAKLPGILPIVAAFFTYLTSKNAQMQQAPADPNEKPKGPDMGMMTIMFPVMILVFGASYPAGLILYWALSNIIQFIQDLVITRIVASEEL
ncbi:MAG TPA: YidC/Oxa1 family membrane protein insertase [Clostridia bacterium]|nr:YidC/Oxa1 family membrane protein insertase [Clostridia bacterium]